MEPLRAFFQQLKGFWVGLSNPKRIALVVATTVSLLGVLAVATVGSRVNYSYLFTDLSTEDAAAISQKLDELKVPYKLEAGGTAIQVPDDRVHALRLELASNGLPRGGGVGFEIFDQSKLGATEFEQNVNLRRALEGELARSIATIDGVRSARVHLVLPERRLFASKKESASASVVLKLRNAQDFGRHEVAGIVHLVAAAVPGLSQDRVSVVSTDGVTLHRPSSDGTGSSFSDLQGEQGRDLAQGMENHVRTLVERVVGPGNADVRIHVKLNTASKERTEEHYEPTRTALRSEHKTEETTGTEGPSVAGVPGAQSNLPNIEPSAEQAEEGGAPGNVFRRSQTRNWEVDRVTEKTSMPAGGVDRLSVAVLVDGSYTGARGKETFVPRSKEQLEQLDAIVKNAVGFDAERGDSVRVEGARFARVDDGADDHPKVPLYKQYWKYLAAAAAALVFLLALFVLVWRKKRKKAKIAEVELQKQLEAAQVPEALGPAPGAAAELPGASDDEVEALPADFRAEALSIATSDPATAAIVLRKWLGASETAQPSP